MAKMDDILKLIAYIEWKLSDFNIYLRHENILIQALVVRVIIALARSPEL